MATGTSEIDDIRRQMAQIRRELHEDMQGVVAGAEAATDWRYYIRLYPWAALAAAGVLGFLIVPRRHSTTRAARKAADETVERMQEVARETAAAPTETAKKKSRFGLLGMIFGMVAPIAVRAAQSYAVQYVEQWLAQQQAHAGPPLGPRADRPPPGGRPGPSRPA